MYYIVSSVGNCCWGTGVSQEQEPRTTDTSLLTPYLSPALTFLPFWKSRGGERGGCEVGVYGGVSEIKYVARLEKFESSMRIKSGEW